MNPYRLLNYIYTIVKLKLNGVEFHYRVLGNCFYINNIGKIIIGEKVYLHSYPNGSCFRTGLSTYYPEAEIIIGNNCYLNGTIIHCNEKVIIGNDCMFGPGTIISDNDSHKVAIDHKLKMSRPVSKPVILEDNVWVGMNCTILKGVKIGANSIIAAGSLVLKNIPPNCLFGGHPAKFIKNLY